MQFCHCVYSYVFGVCVCVVRIVFADEMRNLYADMSLTAAHIVPPKLHPRAGSKPRKNLRRVSSSASSPRLETGWDQQQAIGKFQDYRFTRKVFPISWRKLRQFCRFTHRRNGSQQYLGYHEKPKLVKSAFQCSRAKLFNYFWLKLTYFAGLASLNFWFIISHRKCKIPQTYIILSYFIYH